jgi:hypothetical protein
MPKLYILRSKLNSITQCNEILKKRYMTTLSQLNDHLNNFNGSNVLNLHNLSNFNNLSACYMPSYKNQGRFIFRKIRASKEFIYLLILLDPNHEYNTNILRSADKKKYSPHEMIDFIELVQLINSTSKQASDTQANPPMIADRKLTETPSIKASDTAISYIDKLKDIKFSAGKSILNKEHTDDLIRLYKQCPLEQLSGVIKHDPELFAITISKSLIDTIPSEALEVIANELDYKSTIVLLQNSIFYNKYPNFCNKLFDNLDNDKKIELYLSSIDNHQYITQRNEYKISELSNKIIQNILRTKGIQKQQYINYLLSNKIISAHDLINAASKLEQIKITTKNRTYYCVQELESMNVLMQAAAYGCLEIVKFLYNQNNNLANDIDNKGRNVLMLSVLSQNIDLVEYFLSKGANVNYRDSFECTALALALSTNNKEIVMLLISYTLDKQILLESLKTVEKQHDSTEIVTALHQQIDEITNNTMYNSKNDCEEHQNQTPKTTYAEMLRAATTDRSKNDRSKTTYAEMLRATTDRSKTTYAEMSSRETDSSKTTYAEMSSGETDSSKTTMTATERRRIKRSKQQATQAKDNPVTHEQTEATIDDLDTSINRVAHNQNLFLLPLDEHSHKNLNEGGSKDETVSIANTGSSKKQTQPSSSNYSQQTVPTTTDAPTENSEGFMQKISKTRSITQENGWCICC